MASVDSLVRRLRARVLQSSERERSLDWMSADALEKVQAQNAQLREERDALARDLDAHAKAERIKVEKLEDEPPQDERAEHTPVPSSIQSALNLKEAASLLGVSYSTIYAHRRALGFFQIGNLWRIWPETLREMTMRGAAAELPPVAAPARNGLTSKTNTARNVSRAAAAAKELDELLEKPSKRRNAKR